MKQVSKVAISSLRGMNDAACRYMDKVVILLENSEKEGAKAFERRVLRELKRELHEKLNLIVGTHLNVLTAIIVFPQDGDVPDELMHQVTDVSRNFVKSTQ